jgi:flavin-binding protein dodecin
MNNERNEVDLHDVLKQRAEAGEPIYINGQSNQAVEAAIDGLAKETGKPIRVVQLVGVDTTSLENASQESIEAVLANSNVKVILKN